MAKTREIKGRIKAVANIRRITKTMQLIATAKFQASQRRVVAAQPFTRKVSELVGELSATLRAAGQTGLSHPLLKAPEPRRGRQLLLVVTSNRGLCGGYNASILRQATAFIKDHADDTIDLQVVGKKGLAYFRFSRIEHSPCPAQFGDKPAFADAESLADQFMGQFTQGRYDSVNVLYMSFESASRQRPKVLRLLPLDHPAERAQATAPSAPGAGATYDFSPKPAALLNELLPITVKVQLYQAINEAVVSENVARMVAMKSATDSAGKMGRELNRRYNRARQAAITTELSEIITGAAALEG